MRFKTVVSFSTLSAFVATLAIGCGQGDEIRLAPAPPVEAPKSTPLPKEPEKGGGPASSGNMKTNPGGNS